MLERLRILAITPVLFAIPAGTGFAAEKVDVKANGGMQPIYSFWRTYENSCNSAPPPRHKIIQDPKHGKLVTLIAKAKVPADAKRCAGKPAQFLAVGYQPKRGFRGKDSAAVRIMYNKYSNVNVMVNRTLKFNITVK